MLQPGRSPRATRPLSSARGLRALTIFGALSLIGYIAYFFLIHAHSLWSSPTLVQDRWKKIFYPIKDLFPESWVRANHYSPLAIYNSAAYLILLGLLFAVYFLALRRAFSPGAFTREHGGPALRRILSVTTLALLLLLFVPGVLSSDLFSYIWYGRIFALFHGNPFVTIPAQYAWEDKSHWLQWVYWKNTPSVYGPVWIWMAGAIATGAQALGGDIVNHLLGHKLLADLANLANIVLLWKVSGIFISRYWRRPELPDHVSRRDWVLGMQVAVTLAYAWNPLIVLEFGANAHNDVLLVTGLLAAMLLHLRGRWRLAVFAIALASLVKVIILVFLPGYLWLLFWQRKQASGNSLKGFRSGVSRLAQALAIMAATWVLAYAPFWVGPATLKPLAGGPATEYFINSLGALLRLKLPEALSQLAGSLGWQPYWFWTPFYIGARLDWPARWGLLLVTAAVAVVQTWPARSFPRMVVAWGWVVFTYLTIGSVWFWPWYVGWLIVPAALMGGGRLFKAMQVLCVSSMALYAIFPALPSPVSQLPSWSGLVTVGPPLLYLAISQLWRRRLPKPVGEPEPALPALRRAPAAVPVPLRPSPIVASSAGDTAGEASLEGWYSGPSPPDLADTLSMDD